MTILSKRVANAVGSVTLAMNEKVELMRKDGVDVYNLTAGQLPFRPEGGFINSLQSQLSFLASYQYAPVGGLADLRLKIFKKFVESRFSSWGKADEEKYLNQHSVVVTHGAKHALFNLFAAILNPGDEVILFSPYWVSFPEMIRFWGGVPKIVECHQYDAYTPDLEELEEALTSKVKAIVINSPNNPTGVHYPESWMKQFSILMSKYPEVLIISDELYEQLYYYDPAPTYFYQYEPALLAQTVVINGISKTLAATGLRLGTALGPGDIIKAMSVLQSQSTSGASSLVQHAWKYYDDRQLRPYLQEIRLQLRKNAEILKEILREFELSSCWYQTISAFYFIFDLKQTPYFKKHYAQASKIGDHSQEICDQLLKEKQVAIIPGTNFGMPNGARLSFTLDPELFEQACRRICMFLSK